MSDGVKGSSSPTPTPNFLRDIVSLAQGTEIPASFAMWSGFAAMSAVLGRRIWLDMGTYTIFPNLYVVLVAGSGRCRKSTSINIVEKLLSQLDPRPNLLAQRTTPEALIEALQVVEKMEGTKFTRRTSEGFVIVDELANFLNKKTYEAGLASLLISLYDCKDQFDYRTKARGVEHLQAVCLGMLAGSTIEWIRNAIPSDAIGGGLTSRFIFVYVENPPPPVAITRFSDEKKELNERLVRALIEMQSLQGQMNLSPEAWNLYEEEYNKFYIENRMFEDPTLSGYASRRHVHALKLSMILSIADPESRHDRLVYPRHFSAAISLLSQCEVWMPRVMALISATEKGALAELICTKLHARKSISRRLLLESLVHRIDARDLTEVIETLIQAGRIRCESNGRDIIYYLKEG